MNRSFSKIRHIQEANLKLENRLLEEGKPGSNLSELRMSLPDIVRTLKNQNKGLTGTFTSSGSKVNFVFPDKKVVTLSIPNFAGISSGTWRINGTSIYFVKG
jgi:hypothetical protein